MALDIFSSFDDHNKVYFGWYYLIWIILFMLLVLGLKLNNGLSFNLGSLINLIKLMVNELVGRTSGKEMGGASIVLIPTMLILVFFNFFGLVPYVFSLTSHLVVNFSFALVIWLSIVIMSLTFNIGSFFAHLQPIGSPSFLNPFLCIIELVSLIVRPLTLSVRLSANLSTGHILMGLLGTGFVNGGIYLCFLISILGVFYFMFEMGVCLIQSYIFVLLPTLYADEHPL